MRSSGILLPITSLPSRYGIGTLGEEAYHFAQFLKGAGQKYWQVLPLGPTSFGDSPYQTFSTFAGNPYIIDLDLLIEEGYLKEEDVEHLKANDLSTIDYEFQYLHRFNVLRLAFSKYPYKTDLSFIKFSQEQSFWLDDYALFMSIKHHFQDISWWMWPNEFKMRNRMALDAFIKANEEEINFWKFIQFLFFKQWLALKEYVNNLGIEIIGDIPIYVAQDSSDIWSNPNEWLLDNDLMPIDVAGCPPDAFALTGQLWGNPLYNYDVMALNNYHWWIKRIEASFKIYDIVRIDHFRGFEAYYSIPSKDPTAEFGTWIKGPGINLFNEVKKQLGDVKIIAEDLGFLTPEVYQLLKDTGYPGMKILQFGFDPWNDSEYLPHNYQYNSVVYPGTHDNMPILGWFKQLNIDEKRFCKEYLNLKNEEDIVEQMIKTCLASVCKIAIIPMQDYLELGNEARINIPSTLGGNWVWRMPIASLTTELEQKIAKWTKTYRR